MPGIEASALRNGETVAMLTRGGCYPLTGIRNFGQCASFVESALAYIKSHPSIRRVILAGRWTSAVEGTRFRTKNLDTWFITDDETKEAGFLENPRVFARSLVRTIQALAPLEIYVVEGLPEQKYDIPRVAALNAYFGWNQDVSLSRMEFDSRQRQTRQILSDVAGRAPFKLIDASPYLCNK
jgi:hypothetical protein